jgi:hypothetical protein
MSANLIKPITSTSTSGWAIHTPALSYPRPFTGAASNQKVNSIEDNRDEKKRDCLRFFRRAWPEQDSGNADA